MNVVTNLSLDLAVDQPSKKVISAKQGDARTRFLHISLFNNGDSFEFEQGINARFKVLKPDKNVVVNDAEIVENTIVCELTQQILALPGLEIAEISLYKENQLLSTYYFYIDVKKSAVTGDTVESTDEVKTLETIISLAKSYLEEIQKYNIEEMSKSLNNKVDKEDGKGLSSNDFTSKCKTKLDNLNNYDDSEIQERIRNLRRDVEDIDEQLTESLNSKASQSDLEDLEKEVGDNYRDLSTEIARVNSNLIGNVNGLNKRIDTKANQSDVDELSELIGTLNTTLENRLAGGVDNE